MILTRNLIRCPGCSMQFLQVDWMAHRAAGYCTDKCHEKAIEAGKLKEKQ